MKPSNGGHASWACSVTPATLNRRVLDQALIWIDVTGRVHLLDDMSSAYLFNVLSLLRDSAVRLHFEALVDSRLDLFEGAITGSPAGEGLVLEATGRSIADLDPLEWVETTALVRALQRRLRSV